MQPKAVTFAEGSQLQTIGNNAFDYCKMLESIEIPESVTSIGSYAFDYCNNLKSVTLRCSQLQTIETTLSILLRINVINHS